MKLVKNEKLENNRHELQYVLRRLITGGIGRPACGEQAYH